MVMATLKKHVKAIIQLRRAKESEWIEANPILHLGEPAVSTDKNKIKIGDGKSHWSELEYIGTDYEAGNGIMISNGVISFDENLILDCGTSTTVI